MKTNPDFKDLLSAFADSRVRFLIVGAYALVFYGRPRTTGDLDVWVDATPANAARVFEALSRFGAPLERVRPSDFEQPGVVFQIGVAPNRIDVLTSLTALKFQNAWPRRRRVRFGSLPVAVLSPEDFLRNKKALGRAKDLADIEELRQSTRLTRGSGRRSPRKRARD